MIQAVVKALAQMFTAPLRAVLLKAIGLTLIVIVLIGIGLHRLFAALAQSGAGWAEATYGNVPTGAWSALVWILSIMASFGIVTGALFLMPAVTAFVGSFFVDEIADKVEGEHYPASRGKALPFFRALIEGGKTALLAVAVYLCALPFVLFVGLGLMIMFFANAYLLSREYFELAAMRYRTPAEAKQLRKRHWIYVFIGGIPIAAFVSIPVLNMATPLFAMAYMVHLHKELSHYAPELIEKRS
jgi:CysZ protein